MTFCWCPVCESEVVDAEGFCVLGHRLLGDDPSYRGSSTRPTPTVTAAAGPPPPPPRPRSQEVAPPTQVVTAMAPARQVFRALEGSVELERGDPITAFAPAPIMDWGPSENRVRRAFGSLSKRPRMGQTVDA